MAVKQPSHLDVPDHQGIGIVWAALDAGDVGAWQSYPQYEKKTVEIAGEGRVALEGTMDLDLSADAVSDHLRIYRLTDKDLGDDGRIERPGLYVIKENPWRIRPRVLEGSGVTVTVVATR